MNYSFQGAQGGSVGPLFCLGCGKVFYSVNGKLSHESYCERFKNRAFVASPRQIQQILGNPPVVRIYRMELGNKAMSQALNKRRISTELGQVSFFNHVGFFHDCTIVIIK
jgi:hypothetical protein